MNQQYQQRQNGFAARPKYNKNNGQQQSAPKQEFKPVAILKRGDPSGTTIIPKDDSQSKENISANGQQTKSTSYKVKKSLRTIRNLDFVILANYRTTTTSSSSCYFIIIKSTSKCFTAGSKSFSINTYSYNYSFS